MDDPRFRNEILGRFRARTHEVPAGGPVATPASHRDAAPLIRTGEAENRNCGDRLSISLLLNSSGRIERAGFQAEGCSILVAAGDMVCELLEGKTIESAAGLMHDALYLFRNGAQPQLPASFADLTHEQLASLDTILALREYPARLKCGTLAFSAGLAAVE